MLSHITAPDLPKIAWLVHRLALVMLRVIVLRAINSLNKIWPIVTPIKTDLLLDSCDADQLLV